MSIVEEISQELGHFGIQETEQSVAQRFEKIVTQHGERIAISDANASLSYRALNHLANRMARKIIAFTPAEEPVRIALFLEKGIAQIAAILAVLKCGHAYVPIDPAFPTERNRHIYRESQAALILSNSTCRDTALELTGEDARILDLEDIPDNTPSDNLNIPVTPDALAYIIYTSGSTGQPKGVLQNNRNLLHGCMRRSNLQKVIPDDRMTLFYSCSVIASVYCIFGALLNGAALFPYDFHRHGVEKLADWLRSRRITIYHSVASLFREFAAQYRGPSDVFSIRLVTFGGERVLTSDIALARKVFTPQIEFYTGLGSTETGTIRYFHIGPDTRLEGDVVPIGYAVEGVDVVLLNDDGQEVAAGEIGEITARSRYLAQGYWKNPAATAKSFGRDQTDPNIVIYRTGDLGQMDPDGLLHHRGRKDFQVKIRGFRVEVGEVEARLLAHPHIAEAVVVARDMEGERQLVAYLVAEPVPDDATPLSVQTLRDYLAEQLTYYMIPTLFVRLEQLPKTPNNKVDRNALPAPTADIQLPGAPLIKARGCTEIRLVDFCRELLARDSISVGENFFALGGHSLNAAQLLARINEQFHIRLDMRAVFEATSLRALAERIERIQPETEKNRVNTDDDALVHAPANARLPLSAAQKRMWLSEQLWGNSSAYQISNTVFLQGTLDTAALTQALSAVIARHDILRTCFPTDDEGPRQQILATGDVQLPEVKLRPRPRNRYVTRSQRMDKQALAAGPLFRARLLRVNREAAILALTFHHIIYDNIWSSGIFFRELGHFYQAFIHKCEASLPALNFQFSDYAFWEQRRSGSEGYQAQMAYWQRQLADAPAPLELPTDRPRPQTADFRGGLETFRLPASLSAALRGLARQESVTTFMLLLAAWQLLLHRYTQQSDIVIGTPSGRRQHTQTEPMIGLFINTLVLRTDFSGQPDFRTLLQRVRRTTIDAFANDQVPFEDLVATLNPHRSASESPFFRHLFIHRKVHADHWQIPGLVVTPLHSHSGGAKFDLTLSVLEGDQELSGTLEYRRALFDRATAASLCQNFIQLLTSIVEHPERPAATLPLVAPAERKLLRTAWNRSAAELPLHRSAVQLFEQQAQQYGERCALIAPEQTLDYQTLNRRADRLAQRLRGHGLGGGQLAAVCMTRSANLLIALLAVWKTGAAFVPLDPMFPTERLAYIAQDSAATLLITDAESRGKLAEFSGQIITLEHGDTFDTDAAIDLDKTMESDIVAEIPSPNSSTDDPAYVIYTSGSTGNPKGVQISQRSLVNFLCSMGTQPGFSADDTLLAVTTVCFDIALLELFLPLLSGGRLVIQDGRQSRDPKALQETLRREHVTVMQATPSTWRMLLDHGWRGEPSVRVLCGGEAMGRYLAARLLDCGLEIWNLYGPTETTIWSSINSIRAAEDAAYIGQPIANTSLYVLDPAAQLLPAGVPGELCIGGEGLALGYLNRAQLTGEKFFHCAALDGERLYRTGDLVVRRRDGRIEYLGRMDHQVKIRGFRVEVGEIEALLAEDPAVRQSAVIAHDDDCGSKYLVAYLIAANDKQPDTATLRKALQKSLPEYMLPTAFVTLPEFPLTPNGKVDRKAFTPPHSVSAEIPAGNADFVATHTAIDIATQVREVFQGLLKSPVPSDDVSFFDLGGHSLLALNAVTRLNTTFAIELPPTLLFDFPTVAELAQAIQKFREGQSEQQVLATAGTDARTQQQVDDILAGLQRHKGAQDLPQFPHGMKMRRSWFAKRVLAPLFAIPRVRIRAQLQNLILKLEGGSTFSLTIRELYRKYFNIDVGEFSSVTFDPISLKSSTRIGKFCTIYRTARFQNADHPRNTLSTHGIFYYAGMGFSAGYNLDRVNIEVGNDVWIGDGAKILYPTCKIGDGAVIAAGAIVIEDVPPYAVVAGYPARVVRYRFSRDTIAKLLTLRWWEMSATELHHSRREFLKPLEGERIR
ncbi:amino acid adenylation domain-containing protein [Microbulbifer bruguierae]|uniref:Amino acid adenylation domain-containing protein n=1 Tax=Microbulbifer bruguierae TaxID=3029061 RepID=A0ABY8NH14_9GAMM|nr:non-ribosomal peptide synthetase [Microbulbifer bruguierae]WGL18224.1 amino acid adenylation domain-containing protein [Microbulbifer bruguierae]